MRTIRGPATSRRQSLNRYAYVLNNPGSLVDPLGLQERCTVANGSRDPHVISHEPGLAPSFGNCTPEDVPINCGALFQAIGAGITGIDPIFPSQGTLVGQVLSGFTTNVVGYIPGTDVSVYTLDPAYSLVEIDLPFSPDNDTSPNGNRRPIGHPLDPKACREQVLGNLGANGLNELLHSLLGRVNDMYADLPRASDEEVAMRIFGFAEKLGVRAQLSSALDLIAPRLSTSSPSMS